MEVVTRDKGGETTARAAGIHSDANKPGDISWRDASKCRYNKDVCHSNTSVSQRHLPCG